jgi:tetratricopeptide (TPR) repeat protein
LVVLDAAELSVLQPQIGFDCFDRGQECEDSDVHVQVEQGDLAVALTSFQASLAIAERLAKADPGNAGWQRDLSVSHERIGDVQVEQGDLAAALTSFHASLAIRERLAKADPGNAGWQRDLALSYGRLAIVKASQGMHDDALSAFRKGRQIVARLSQQLPDNVTLQNDLAWFDEQIAAQRN